MPPSTAISHCPTCGEPIHPLAPAGNCPRCLLSATSGAGKAEPEGRGDLPEVPRFRLIEEIGEGAFGIVYRAEQTEPVNRPAAVKVMKSRAVEGVGLTRFHAERQALARMEHPGIATLFDAGQSASGRPFFAMELVDGGVALNEYAAGLALRERLALFQKVCQAVAHAHQKGIVHRDLKPSNILVAKGERTPNSELRSPSPKVIDFGIAKATEELLTDQTLLTRAGQMMGTPQYMSPEQAAGSMGVDTRADVYSLGALLYELVAGRPPFEDESETTSTLETLLRSIREEIPIPPSRAEPDLSAIALRALEKEPARRYGTVAELEADIARYLAGETVSARAPSPLYRLRKFIGRNRLPVAAAAVAVVALVVGGVASALLAVKANKASAKADTAEAETRRTFADSDAAAASALVVEDPAAAAAHLCRALRNAPDHPTAGYQLMRLLADHTFAQEKNSARMNAIGPVNFLEFAAGGEHLVATCEWDGAYLLRSDDFSPVVKSLLGPRHTNYRTESDVSPDGERVIVGYRDALSRIWSTRDGRPLSPVLNTGAEGGQSPVVFGMDNRRVFAGGGAGLVGAFDHDDNGGASRAWHTRIGTRFNNPGIITLGVSPDGATLVVGSQYGRIEWMNADNGERLATTRDPSGVSVNHTLFAASGARLITTTWSGSICVWDTADRTLISQQDAHAGDIFRVEISPDGERFATSSHDGFARVWNAVDGKPITPLLPHTGRSQGVAFNRDGTLIATSDRKRFARVWDARTGELYCAPILHDASLCAVIFDPKTDELIAGSRDGMLRRWDIRDRRAQPISIAGATQPQWPSFQNDAEPAVLLWERRDQNGTALAQRWSVASGTTVGEQVPMPRGISWRARRGFNRSLFENFDASLAPELADRLQRFGEKIGDARCAAISPDLSRALACFDDGRCLFLDFVTGETLGEASPSGHGAPHRAEISSEGKTAAVAFADGFVLAFDVTTATPIGIPMELGGQINDLIIAPDGEHIAASGHHGARVWKFPGGEALTPRLQHGSDAQGNGLICDFSPDGSLLATTLGSDQSVMLWDALDGSRRQTIYTGDTSFGIHFAPCGHLIYTLGGDVEKARGGRLRAWEISTGMLMSTRPGGRLFDKGNTSSDGHWLVTTHLDHGVQFHAEPPRETVPVWFLDAAEAFTRRRFNAGGSMEIVPLAEVAAPLEKALGRGGAIGEWADWLFAEPGRGRPLSPGMAIDKQPPQSEPVPLKPSLWQQLKERLIYRRPLVEKIDIDR